jgi:hypothetical protein
MVFNSQNSVIKHTRLDGEIRQAGANLGLRSDVMVFHGMI